MGDVNQVVIIGRLCTKPQMRYNGDGVAYTTFQIAVNRGRTQPISPRFMKDRNQQDAFVDYPWVMIDGDQAENCALNLRSGMRVAIHEASVRTHRYAEPTSKLEIKFCPHCGHSLENIELQQTDSRKWKVCANKKCNAEVLFEKVRLATDIKAKQVEFLDQIDQGNRPGNRESTPVADQTASNKQPAANPETPTANEKVSAVKSDNNKAEPTPVPQSGGAKIKRKRNRGKRGNGGNSGATANTVAQAQ